MPPPDIADIGPSGATLARPWRAALSLTGYLLNTLVWCPPIILLGIVKRISPNRRLGRACARAMNAMATAWVAGNAIHQDAICPTRWRVSWEIGELRKDGWYLILANHQSWVDILALQRLFLGRIPFIKFFLKQGLIWLPLLGPTWMALDFPFMRRYSRSTLKHNPRLMGKDMTVTREACEKFRELPVAIMHFAEGTRFSADKRAAQQSPYARLLRIHPKGVACILDRLSDRLDGVLDVTIAYPHGTRRFWDFVCGDIPEIRVHVRSLAIVADFMGDYSQDRGFRRRFHQRLNRLWAEKDRRMSRMMSR